MSTHFSTALKTLRLARGLTQRELGERLGYAETTAQSVISLWERGRSKGPGVELLRRLAAVLDVRIADLTGEAVAPPACRNAQDAA